MTRYQGGKARIGKEIHDNIIKLEKDLNIFENEFDYFEPFIGMAGVMRHFGNDNETGVSTRKLYASDINKDVVLMWKALQKGWSPPSKCTEKMFLKLKYSKKHSAARGFVGNACSFGGMFFGSFAGNYTSDDVSFAEVAKRNIKKITPSMEHVKFLNPSSYTIYSPKNMVIYCDPPYLHNNISSKFFKNFNHDEFWDIMREWSKNNVVIISERVAPKDFKPIWSKKYRTTTMNKNKIKNMLHTDTEKLFIHETIYRLTY